MTGADITDALAEEIRKKYGGRGGVKAFVETLEGVNYFTYLDYFKPSTPDKQRPKMSTDLLMISLAALDVDPVMFLRQLRDRLEAEGQ